MKEHDDALFESAQRIIERAAKQSTQAPTTVRIEPGSTAINVGNVTIGSQTIHQAPTPTKPKGR